MIKGIIGGVIGGAIGAAIWAAIAYFAHVQIGLVAIGVGALVGGGTFMFAGDQASPLTGVAAAIIALASIAGGKFMTVHAYFANIKGTVHKAIIVDDEVAVLHIARQVAQEWEQSGKKIAWPTDVKDDKATEESEFPTEVWSDAKVRWSAMSQTQQDGYKRDLEANLKGEVDGVVAGIESDVFAKSFSFFDILWGFLAIGAAYKLGSGEAEG
ncbi:MAG: hypothetical protein KF691_11560 [Phycisphaeraceae bacterium]|nr:hypothetical protein [Phycisphaeraceae bacterium]